MFGLGNRKFSINRNTGVPKPSRRFSVGEPSVGGLYPLFSNSDLLAEPAP